MWFRKKEYEKEIKEIWNILETILDLLLDSGKLNYNNAVSIKNIYSIQFQHNSDFKQCKQAIAEIQNLILESIVDND